jgi:hypothetical protein
MNLTDLMCALRQRLWTAWNTNNQDDLSLLMTTFGVLREELYASKNGGMIDIVQALEEATRRAIMGFKSIAEIPPEQAIRKAFDELH